MRTWLRVGCGMAIASNKLRANMDAMLECASVAIKTLQKELDHHYLQFRALFPDWQQAEEGYWNTSHTPRLYNWPNTGERALVGLAICDAVLTRTKNSALLEFAAQNRPGDRAGSVALYQLLESSEYWSFSKHLRVAPNVRKDLAIKHGLGTCYLWPKEESQFIYIVEARNLIARAGVAQ